jgi:hypothetical protein
MRLQAIFYLMACLSYKGNGLDNEERGVVVGLAGSIFCTLLLLSNG